MKMAYRARECRTPSERWLERHLRVGLPHVHTEAQWCFAECDYRVDFFIPALGMVLEVDGLSHRGREGADRLRSMDLRALGYEVARVRARDVRRRAGSIVAQLAFRAHIVVSPPPPAAEEPAEVSQG
jgi:very-short-patch-repair endonuclease